MPLRTSVHDGARQMRERSTLSLGRTTWRWGFGALAALLLFPLAAAQGPAAATPPPTVTILDGPAVLLRGAAKLQLAEGVRLLSQDVVETAADNRLLRIEFPDGMALNLGPGTRLLIDPRLVAEKGRVARTYLQRGWVKLNAAPAVAGKPPAATAAPLASPLFDLQSAGGSIVAQVTDTALQVFVESGEAMVLERQAGLAVGTPQKLRSGEFLARAGSGKSAVSPRPPADFVPQLPRSFLDTLPSRAAMFKDRDVAPKALADISYADAQAWLTAEPALRRPAMPRWRPLTRNPAFRNALVANMAAHPEWDRVLFPEKYLPKPNPGGAAAAGASTSR